MDSMFEILLGLPLFHGVSYQKMSEIIGKNKFHFLKFEKGDTITEEGAQCTHIMFLLSGKVRSSIYNADRRFCVAQTLEAPDVIAPEFLFGKSTFYPCTVKALESTGILQISKSDYLKIINSDPVFLINLLNLISTSAQRSVEGILSLTTGDLEERIAFWIVALTQRGGKDISLSCKQRDLYSVFGVQRSSLLATLERMKEEKILDFSNAEISIIDRSKLVEKLEKMGKISANEQ